MFGLVFICSCFLVIPVSASKAAKLNNRRSDDSPALATVVENLSQKVASLEALVEKQASTIQQHDSQNKAAISALTASMQKEQAGIAFHAEFKNDNVPVGPMATLILDNVVTNVGSCYDKLTGQFTAKVAGTYLIQAHFMSAINDLLYVHIYVDDKSMEYGISHGSGAWDHASESLVLHLNAGQRVHLVQGSSATHNIRGNHWTSFSGFLIQTDA